MEKVIDHLNECLEKSSRRSTWTFVRKDIIKDTIALLKEQEAVKPEPIMGTSISDCGKCRHAVAPGMDYCPVCGCRIDWN